MTKLYVSPEDCPTTELPRHALFLTEFFNQSVDRVAAIGASAPDGMPVDRVDVGSEGRLLLAGGEPLVARYVVTQPEIESRDGGSPGERARTSSSGRQAGRSGSSPEPPRTTSSPTTAARRP